MKRALKFLIRKFIYASIAGGLFLGAMIGYVALTWHMPSVAELKNYNPPTITRFYAADEKIFAEFAQERRIFVSYDKIPPALVKAFLIVEDKNFFHHKGIDHAGIFRAVIKNIRNLASGHSVRMGGSTITQQVAKNFFLSHTQTFTRKIKEMLLAFKIEELYTKEKILELYLNEIYLGGGSYGIESAARYYFNKSLAQLTLGEVAYLSILPKAPNYYNYFHHKDRAFRRRNWALNRMFQEGLITEEQCIAAQAEPLLRKKEAQKETVDAAFFSEMLRQEILKKYGEKLLYKEGLIIKTTLDSKLQKIAEDCLREGLVTYDRRFGWRGALGTISLDKWQENIRNFPKPKALAPYTLATVLEIKEDHAVIGLLNSATAILPLKHLTWARKHIYSQGTLFPRTGPEIKKVEDVLHVGAVIPVSATPDRNKFKLEQIPEVEGAIVALDPKTGNILAMVGGYSFERSQFNRAVQSKRQPGSAFKTFVFLAALENGYTPTSLISDEEIEIEIQPGKMWHPKNITEKSYGLVELKRALARSMNLAPIWLAQQMGIQPVQHVARKFGITSHLPPEIVTVLGTTETTLLRLTSAYATLINGGRKVRPTWIQSIQDRHENLIFQSPDTEEVPITSEQTAYDIVKILERAVTHGASRRAHLPGHYLAGKTGSTNDYFDAWFVGFSTDLVVGVFVGFDHPKSLGKKQTGGVVAAPIFKKFMERALKGTRSKPFKTPQMRKVEWIESILDSVDHDTNAIDDSFDNIIPSSIF